MKTVAMNLLGIVEHPAMPDWVPYRVDRDGRPYVPAGDGGVVLGVRLGDSAFGFDADHAAPGACLVHPDPAARHALTAYACVGNRAQVRTGAAAGAVGAVAGKRGEEGRVIVAWPQDVLALLRPGDEVSVRAHGQGVPARGDVEMLNLDPELAARLAIGERVEVRRRLPSRLAGNGIGRPAHMWDLDLQLSEGDLRLGDLVALDDVDVRHNMGFRRGRTTIGLVVHGSSPLPGHGPGVVPILTGPADAVDVVPNAAAHTGLTEDILYLGHARQ
jgi:hypothetical protein